MGDPFSWFVRGCFSNPVDSRKAHGDLRCGAEAGALPLYPRRG